MEVAEVPQRWIVEKHLACTKRTPGNGDNVVSTVIFDVIAARDAWAELNLVGDRADCGFSEEAIQMGGFEVGNADGAGFAAGKQFLEGLPGGEIFVALGQGPVDQQQINILHVKLAQALIETGNGKVIALKLAIQLGGDKHILAGNAAVADALAHATLVAIAKGSVDVTVTSFDCSHNHWRNLLVVERSGAQTDLWNGVAVVEAEAWYAHGWILSDVVREVDEMWVYGKLVDRETCRQVDR